MFTSVVAALALAASVSRVAASPAHHAPRSHARIARSYAQDADVLEDYTPYHTRYIALGCKDQRGTDFFEQCCHPMTRDQQLSDLPAQCIPSASASSSAAAVEPSASVVDEDPVSTSSAKPTWTRKATTTQAPTTYAPTSTKMVTSVKPTTSAAASSGGGEVFSGGQATWFTQNGVAGACGTAHSDNDHIVAVDSRRYGALDKQSSLCGKKVLVTNTANGKQVTCTVADVCPTCLNSNSLDMSTGAFNAIGNPDDGVLPITYTYV